MRKCIRTELWKALHDRMFYLSLLLGLVIVGIHIGEIAVSVNEIIPRIMTAEERGGNPDYVGISLFARWIGVDWVNYGGRMLYLVWPALAALPFGWSYAKERKDGVYDQIAVRCGRKEYYTAKYIAVFVSGALAVAIPVLVDLLALAMFCPAAVVQFKDNIVPLCNGCFLPSLFYTHPWVYTLLWCGIELLWGGAAACLCFVVGTKLRLQMFTMLFPFAALFLLDAAILGFQRSTFASLLGYLTISPLRLAQASTGGLNPEWVVFLTLGVLIAGSFGVGYWQVVKHELA